jgi:HSP20 family protein
MANTKQQQQQQGEMTRWEPFEGLSPFGATFGRFFDDVWGRHSGTEDGNRLIAPPVDVCEDENHLTITTELPGLAKEDVKIQVENNVLVISGEKRLERDEQDKNFLRLERRYGSFYRAISLPKGVNSEGADAEFRDGVLRVRLPKREDVKPRTVKIK